MSNPWEIAANLLNALSILLAGLNRVHTWWVGIVGCVLFGWVFLEARLYADVTLQLFFIVTSAVGWWQWVGGTAKVTLPVRRTRPAALCGYVGLATVAAAGYGWLLHRFTDAFAPFLDSVVLTFSVLAQLLLMRRRYESWWCWLVVNTIAVPLYYSRGLTLTAVLYSAFWLNAVVALVRWRALIEPDARPV